MIPIESHLFKFWPPFSDMLPTYCLVYLLGIDFSISCDQFCKPLLGHSERMDLYSLNCVSFSPVLTRLQTLSVVYIDLICE